MDDELQAPEPARLAALRAYDVLGRGSQPGLDRIVQAAAQVCGWPIALVTLVEADRAWFTARCGLDAEQTDSESTFCVHAVRAGAELEVPDARLDARFRDNPAVTGAPHVRSYAGFPLRAPGGEVLGTLCIAGYAPAVLDEAQRVVLRVLAEQVVAQLEMRRLLARQTALNVDLAERESVMHVLLDTAETAIMACDATGRPTFVNRAMRELYGLPERAAQDPAGELAALVARGYDAYEADGCTPLAADRLPVVRALTEGPVRGAEMVVRCGDAAPRTLLVNANTFSGPDGTLLGAVATGHDVTVLRVREAALVASQARFRAAFEHGPMPMARLDQDGVLREVNPALRRMLSVPSARLLGTELASRAHTDDAPVLRRALVAASCGPADLVEARFLRADGVAVWCEVAVNRVPEGSGPDAVLVQLADVTERKRQQQVLEARARRDPLTGLPNREALSMLLTEQLAPDGAEIAGTALLFVDLDHFKHVNDTCGHEAGDAVLVETARRLTSTVRAWDTVLRYGGDEFVVVCRDPKDPVRAGAALAERIRQVVGAPFRYAGVDHVVGASVGVATAAPGEDLAAVLARADEEMYRLKRHGRRPGEQRLAPAVASG